MNLLLIEKISFNTSLNPVEICEILQEQTEPTKIFGLNKGKRKKYEGYVFKNAFEITSSSRGKETPINVKGRVKELTYGSEINIKIGPHFTSYIIFPIFMISALATLLLFGMDSFENMKFNKFLFFPIALIAVCLNQLLSFFNKRKEIKVEIKTLLQANY